MQWHDCHGKKPTQHVALLGYHNPNNNPGNPFSDHPVNSCFQYQMSSTALSLGDVGWKFKQVAAVLDLTNLGDSSNLVGLGCADHDVAKQTQFRKAWKKRMSASLASTVASPTALCCMLGCFVLYAVLRCALLSVVHQSFSFACRATRASRRSTSVLSYRSSSC